MTSERRATRSTTCVAVDVSSDEEPSIGRSSSTQTVIEIGEDRQRRTYAKLSRLKDKTLRYESHKDFLEKCIKDKGIPEGLRIHVEPSIGNHDDEFLAMWYCKHEGYSLDLTQEITNFCEKMLAKTAIEIKEKEQQLKATTTKAKYKEMK